MVHGDDRSDVGGGADGAGQRYAPDRHRRVAELALLRRGMTGGEHRGVLVVESPGQQQGLASRAADVEPGDQPKDYRASPFLLPEEQLEGEQGPQGMAKVGPTPVVLGQEFIKRGAVEVSAQPGGGCAEGAV